MDYSTNALVRFIESAEKRGDILDTTAKNWMSAIKTILVDLSENEQADIRTVDVETAVRRFGNRRSGNVSGSSLRTYRTRLEAAIGEFVRYTNDPLAYKPKTNSSKKQSATQKIKVQRRLSDPESVSTIAASDSSTVAQPVRKHREQATLHINLQIHIAPDASPDQIEQIFVSMAKHLKDL